MSSTQNKTVLVTEMMALIAVLLSQLIVVFVSSRLPVKIPVHFSFSGVPNDYGNKETIWLLPVMGALIYIVLSLISLVIKVVRRPDQLSDKMLRSLQWMLRLLKLVFSFLFLHLVIGTIRISLGQSDSLGSYSTLLFLLTIAIILVISIYRLFRMQATS